MTNEWIRAVVAGVALYPIAFCAGAQQPAPAPQPGYVAPPAYSTPPNLGTQTTLIQVPSPQPVITITASATNEVANDRMLAMLRAETDNADAARAAGEVNARMARALSQAKSVSGIDARTTGYSSYQISEPNRPLRWRVSQTLALESGDFVALSALVSKLQGSDGLLLSGLSFTVSPSARHAAEDALTTQAIKSWQQRAQNAARAFGAGDFRTGRVTIQTNDFGRPQPMFKAGGVSATSVAPVSVEGGTSEVTVTVSGEAILDTVRVPR
ncbi:MAG TPA: SIMPL domain-containing protein [Casimicrobiaceae bacterium]|nr:SIMPL domain-containing protein [Casimicrobiaceae bacterium]